MRRVRGGCRGNPVMRLSVVCAIVAFVVAGCTGASPAGETTPKDATSAVSNDVSSSVDSSSIFVRNRCPVADADMGGGDAIGDAPSGQGMSFDVNRDHSIVCLFNWGGASWSLTLDGRPLLAAVIQATGIDNPLTPPVAGQKPKTARYVWGVADQAVASVSVNVAGKIIKAKFYSLTTDVHPFLVQVPGDGAVAVTATDSGGGMVSAVHPEAPNS